jgi:regulator of replication initiation timing
MAISTPERDRDREATSLPTELRAPLKRRARITTEQNEHYCRRPPQPDLSADDSDTIQIESNQPIRQARKSTATNKDLLTALTKIIQQQNETIQNLERETREIRKNQQAIIDHNVKLIDEIAELKTRVDDLVATASSSARTWASVASASAPVEPSATSGTLANQQHTNRTNLASIDVPNVTVDISRADTENGRLSAGAVRAAVEREMRTMENQENWRCRAVTVDHATQSRIRIACRDEDEHQLVKRAAEKIGAGSRVLRDELYPVKIDNVKRTAVLDEKDEIRAGAAEAFGGENGTTVAKIAWLSKRDVPKAYGSMVVYVTKKSDARRLIAEGFFHAGGESGTTSAFERRPRPGQCYNCQELGHKAYQCRKAQRCGRCAKDGHHHKSCSEVVMKCVLCGGPHESFSRNCRMLYPPQHE